jgi:hypothetical protein
MARKSGGQNNSFKHGTFAGNFVTLPDEKHDEFEQLHQGLIEEWKPAGALEEDAAFTLAQCIWLKRRVDRFYYREAMHAQDHPDDHVLNDVDRIATMLTEDRTLEEVRQITNLLPEIYKSSVERIPRSKFNDEKSWIQSLKSEIQDCIVLHEAAQICETQTPRFKAALAAKVRELTSKKNRTRRETRCPHRQGGQETCSTKDVQTNC